jgi:hypothetical protein
VPVVQRVTAPAAFDREAEARAWLLALRADDYRFESRFTTWAYKFAIFEAAVRTRRRAWQEREPPIDPDAGLLGPSGAELPPNGVGVVLEAEHLCMSLRGVQKAGARTVTSALHGLLRDDPRTREEFLSLTGGRR